MDYCFELGCGAFCGVAGLLGIGEPSRQVNDDWDGRANTDECFLSNSDWFAGFAGATGSIGCVEMGCDGVLTSGDELVCLGRGFAGCRTA